MEFLRGRSPDGLSKVTVSSPVRQLFWNQQWLCRLSQLFLGQLVLWMVLMEMNPVWSLSLLTERSPASKQDFPKAKLLGIEPLTSARYQDRSKADGLNRLYLTTINLLMRPIAQTSHFQQKSTSRCLLNQKKN